MILRGGEEEAAAPKYAHVERERRFLVRPDRRPDLSTAPFVRIEDRYVTGTRMRLRRMTDSAAGRVVFKLGKKYEAADPLARPIVTTYLTEVEYDLLATLPAATISKRSYGVPGASGRWRLDLFEGALAGLETAEFDAEDDAILRAAMPEPWCGREVSADQRYEAGLWRCWMMRPRIGCPHLACTTWPTFSCPCRRRRPERPPLPRWPATSAVDPVTCPMRGFASLP